LTKQLYLAHMQKCPTLSNRIKLRTLRNLTAYWVVTPLRIKSKELSSLHIANQTLSAGAWIPQVHLVLNKWIWKIDIMPKIKIFLWQICHQAIPVRGKLLKRGLNIDAGYPVCLSDIESIDHLFSKCQIGNKVWELADKHQWFTILFSLDSCQQLTETLQRVRSSRNPRLLQKLSFLIWIIWKERNSVVFENKFFNPLKCLIKAKKAYAEWKIWACRSIDHTLMGAPFTPPEPFHLVRWNPPPPGVVKINFNGLIFN